MELVTKRDVIYLIDASGFLYRAYYGLRPLHTQQGVPVQAVYSFCRMIKKLIDAFDPHYIALVWDSKGETVRHRLFPSYKATRAAPPNDLFKQKRLIQNFADLIELKQFERQGVEADDILFSCAHDFAMQGSDVVVITSDKDMLQAISERVTIYDPFKNMFINAAAVNEHMGFPLQKLSFYYALVGDASDNIPGVKGIGAKTATQLVQQFESLNDLYAHLDEVHKKPVRHVLQKYQQDAYLSEQLFSLRYIPCESTVSQLAFTKTNWGKAQPLFEALQFTSLLQDLVKHGATLAPKKLLSELKGYTFKTITDIHELHSVLERARALRIVAFDTELDGLDPLENQVVGISLCAEKGRAYYVPCEHTTGEFQLSRDQVLQACAPLLHDKNVKKIMHNANFDERALMHYGYGVHDLDFDTMLAAHLVVPEWQSISLKSLSEFYLHESMLAFADVVTRKGYKDFSMVPIAEGTEYAASDAHQTLQLVEILQQELKKQHMEDLYYTIELPLIPIIVAMEREGIILDVRVLEELDRSVVKDLERIRHEIIMLSGCDETINLNSTQHIKHLLFGLLKLTPSKKSAKKTGYSTDVTVLQSLAALHPVPALLLDYRELSKLKNTYIDGLPQYINTETGKIHTTFSQTTVATGRLASSDPNLQNIPTDTRYHIHIRSAFKPEEGHVFLSADYSQIELRVLAYLSQDSTLIDAFLNDQDIHTKTASKLFEVEDEAVTSAQRLLGKRVNFSILYGLTPYGLAQQLNISLKEAQHYIEKYFAQYPMVSAWMERVIQETKEHGYVTTLWGRRRAIPTIYEKNKVLYNLACRIAINTKAQGTAAELMKQAMINVNRVFTNSKIYGKMLLQIHDELLISVPIDNQKEVEELVRETLEQVVAWNVPLKVVTRLGNTWQDVTR